MIFNLLVLIVEYVLQEVDRFYGYKFEAYPFVGYSV